MKSVTLSIFQNSRYGTSSWKVSGQLSQYPFLSGMAQDPKYTGLSQPVLKCGFLIKLLKK